MGRRHGGARSPANLPINRGFDSHLGFLKGGEDHWNQGSGSANGEGPGTIDLWAGHVPSNMSGTYSGFLYADRTPHHLALESLGSVFLRHPSRKNPLRAGAVQVIEEFAASLDAAGQAKLAGADDKLFIYLAWHNTHTPLECPEEWMFPPLASWHNNNSQRNTYNCMARVLDDGIGNVTKALRAAQLWDETLMLFSVKSPPHVFDS